MNAPDEKLIIDIKAIAEAFKKGLRKTGIKFDVHKIQGFNDRHFFVHFEYRPLTQVPYGPFIPVSIQDRYDIYSVDAYVDRKLTQHIDIHFIVRDDDLKRGG